MLSAQSVPVVRATLPAVGASLSTITELFYRRMFEERPELLRNLFNRTNQATGAQREALAGAVAAFATLLIERPDERPDAVLSRIAHKHVSLGITADQYTLVGRHLLGAVAEVLGDAVTPEVGAAWDEVYWLMANALIAIEARLYAEADVDDGDVWRNMETVERRQETADTISLVLRRTDGRPTAPFRPGQYVSVRVQLPDGARQIRQYSLSTAPDHKTWRITVKREKAVAATVPDGEVSSWLHTHAEVGDLLEVSLPAGDLVLPDSDTPLLLASAGIGITPMLSMLHHLALTSSARPVTVVHADRTPADHVHRDEQADLVSRLTSADLHLWYENDAHHSPGLNVFAGRAALDHLTLAPDTAAYLCGPLPFMRTVRGELLARGLHPAAIHYEVFGPDLWR
ncbi:globin domain-containing protein [Streptomyces turgidiscabies]|uniref:Flavohemoprotein n=1 Tax=Streptomyces turgidiscabies (strain Car8) TaxID=698760 RepID=L7EYU3_STRT8|nr:MULTISPECIES: globin domain-containing protein [Streptomyces]ELP64182.1 putative nitric oxide dioxygenase [Streptomyces turgidiscabies Car8]MDX3491572.1 FAD-binding oxidoreductase [Streptomyces turgidiscabies]GAQ73177.1 flavohemoprotein [Streptomyces turgidiscabies]